MQHNENAILLQEQEAQHAFFAELRSNEGKNLQQLETNIVNLAFMSLENDVPPGIVLDLCGLWRAVNAYNQRYQPTQ